VSLTGLPARDRADFERLLNQPEGARFIAYLIAFCETFDANVEGNLAKEGMRNVGLMLYAMARSAPGGEAAWIRAREQRAETYRNYREEGDEEEA
jgi:hypothetical protein